MADVSAKVTELTEAMAEFNAQYTKFTTEQVNSAGSKARKALMIAKKACNVIRKSILDDQKSKKAAKKEKPE